MNTEELLNWYLKIQLTGVAFGVVLCFLFAVGFIWIKVADRKVKKPTAEERWNNMQQNPNGPRPKSDWE